MTCAACRFWDEDDLEKAIPHLRIGGCSRRAPMVLPKSDGQGGQYGVTVTVWPQTAAADTCGDFEPWATKA